jgi:hypothetical protein
VSKYKDDPEWPHDLAYAMEQAADFLDAEEFGGDNRERQEAAFREVSVRIRKMLIRHLKKAVE